MSIGKRVLQSAKAAGISQSELARRLDANPSTVSLWGKGSSPESDKIAQIAEILGVSTTYLLTGETEVAEPDPIQYPSAALTPDDITKQELDLLRIYRYLSSPEQMAVMTILHSMWNKRKKDNKEDGFLT